MMKNLKAKLEEARQRRVGEAVKKGRWEVYDNRTDKTIKIVKNAGAATRLMNRLMDSGKYDEIAAKWIGDEKKESVSEDLDTPSKYSNPESKLHIDADITKMSKVLGKASQQVIKIMMDGVKDQRYDALDIQRGIEFGPMNRTHEGERPFMKMLWRKVRSGFRRYMPKGKLRK